jgi:hypothetical protein
VAAARATIADGSFMVMVDTDTKIIIAATMELL